MGMGWVAVQPTILVPHSHAQIYTAVLASLRLNLYFVQVRPCAAVSEVISSNPVPVSISVSSQPVLTSAFCFRK